VCRGQLPVWQQYLEDHPDPGFDLIAVAADAEPDQVRVWATRQRLDYPVLVDATNQLGRAFALKAIPNAILLDRQGVVRWMMVSTFSVKKPEVVAHLEAAVGALPLAGEGAAPARVDGETPAQRLYREGAVRMAAGDREGAAALWRQATEQDPDDFVIRKQLWRALNPGRFGETIDLDWQKEQMQREGELGRSAANPLP